MPPADYRDEHPDLKNWCLVQLGGVEGYFFWWEYVFKKGFQYTGRNGSTPWGGYSFGIVVKQEHLQEVFRTFQQFNTLRDYWDYGGGKHIYDEVNPSNVKILAPPPEDVRWVRPKQKRRGKRHRFTLPSPLVYLTEEDDPCG